MARALKRVFRSPNIETRRRQFSQNRPFPANVFEDDETQDPNEEPQRQPGILQELKELQEMMSKIDKRQIEMEKSLNDIKKKIGSKDFELAKSSHAEKVNNILAKAYIQIGRFTKPNNSKTEQLQLEFQNSPYGLAVADLMVMAQQHEKAKFTYWRAEERRRVLGVGNWASLYRATTRELASKICGLLGVKYNAVLEGTVLRQTSLVRIYIAEVGRTECQKDDKFWLNFNAWKEAEYGPRGPNEMQWETILAEHENH